MHHDGPHGIAQPWPCGAARTGAWRTQPHDDQGERDRPHAGARDEHLREVSTDHERRGDHGARGLSRPLRGRVHAEPAAPLVRRGEIGQRGRRDGAEQGGGAPVYEAHDDQRRESGRDQVAERQQGEDTGARDQHHATSDDIREGPGRKLQEDTGQRRCRHDEPHDLGRGPELPRIERQHRRANHGVAAVGQRACGAESRQLPAGASGHGRDSGDEVQAAAVDQTGRWAPAPDTAPRTGRCLA